MRAHAMLMRNEPRILDDHLRWAACLFSLHCSFPTAGGTHPHMFSLCGTDVSHRFPQCACFSESTTI